MNKLSKILLKPIPMKLLKFPIMQPRIPSLPSLRFRLLFLYAACGLLALAVSVGLLLLLIDAAV